MYDVDDAAERTLAQKADDFHEIAQDFGGGDLTDTIWVDLECEFTDAKYFTINPQEAYIMFNALAEHYNRKANNGE